MRFTGGILARAAVLLAILFAPALARAQAYPDRNIRIIVSFVPGGGADLVARTIAAKMQESLGKPVLVENRPGGTGGSVGIEAVVRSPPDGYTLLLTPNGAISISSHLQKPSYDVLKDLEPIGMAAFAGAGIAVPATLPIHNIKELVAASREAPNGFNFSHPGVGNQGHLAGELLKIVTGAKLTGVPYKGNSPTVNALLTGETQVAISDLASLLPLADAGKVRIIAVTNAKRQRSVPDVPTVAEQGFPEYSADAWAGVFAPAGTPRDIIARLNAELNRVMVLPDVRETVSKLGMDATTMSSEDMRKFVNEDFARWGKVISSANIKIE